VDQLSPATGTLRMSRLVRAGPRLLGRAVPARPARPHDEPCDLLRSRENRRGRTRTYNPHDAHCRLPAVGEGAKKATPLLSGLGSPGGSGRSPRVAQASRAASLHPIRPLRIRSLGAEPLIDVIDLATDLG